jgi:flagellar basal-body rod protein FlgG
MNEVLAIGLQGMQADMGRVEQISMNLANALTPAYKRGIAMQSPVGASFAAHLAGMAAPVNVDSTLASHVLTYRADSQAGTLRKTGQPLDIALGGKAYFEIATDNGPAYTRQGSFRLDASGRLVTAQGYPVMGQSGEIVLTTATPVVTATGAVLAPGGSQDAPLAQLKLVEFDANAQPQRLGDGLFAPTSDMKVLQPQDAQVRQGFLENSNVASTHEMTELIQAMRHFESMQKLTQGYDDMLGTAIRKLGEGN